MARGAAPLLSAAWLAAAACGFDAPRGAPDGPPADPDAAAPDAVPDAPPFDPVAACPPAYATQLASTSATSRYRVITTPARFWPHNADCNDDLSGVTHAATLGTMQELLELKAHLDTLPSMTRYYLGGVQDPQAAAANEGWIWFDDTPLLQTAWHTPEDEPDDANAGNEDHNQQLLIIDRELTYLHDAAGVTSYGIVCECDGAPVTATARRFVDEDPVNPN